MRFWFWIKVRVSFRVGGGGGGVGGNQTIVAEENCPWLGFVLGLVLALGGAIFLGGNYSRKFPEIFKHSIPTKLTQLAIQVER